MLFSERFKHVDAQARLDDVNPPDAERGGRRDDPEQRSGEEAQIDPGSAFERPTNRVPTLLASNGADNHLDDSLFYSSDEEDSLVKFSSADDEEEAEDTADEVSLAGEGMYATHQSVVDERN